MQAEVRPRLSPVPGADNSDLCDMVDGPKTLCPICAHPGSISVAIGSRTASVGIVCRGAANQLDSKTSHPIRNGSPPICKQGVAGSIPVTSTI